MTARREGGRTQAERSARTRGALIEAALECLVETGFARTTTTCVAARAGVSLGALVHHFPSKNDLLTATVAHLLERRQSEFRAQMADVGNGSQRVEKAIDLLWAAFSGPTFVAWVELWIGGRCDPELAPAVREVEERFMTSSRQLFREVFPPEEYAAIGLDERGLAVAFAVMEGVALKSIGGRPVDLSPIQSLKAMVRRQPPTPS